MTGSVDNSSTVGSLFPRRHGPMVLLLVLALAGSSVLVTGGPGRQSPLPHADLQTLPPRRRHTH